MNGCGAVDCGHRDLAVGAGTAGSGHHARGVTDSWTTLCESLDVLVPLKSRLNNKRDLLRWVLRDHQTLLRNKQ